LQKEKVNRYLYTQRNSSSLHQHFVQGQLGYCIAQLVTASANPGVLKLTAVPATELVLLYSFSQINMV